jgi:hypothetical protein
LSKPRWNLRKPFASPEQVSSFTPRSPYIQEEDGAVSGLVSVAVLSEGSSVFDTSFSGDEDGYESDEDTEPSSSIIVDQSDRPFHSSVSSVKKDKGPVRAIKPGPNRFSLLHFARSRYEESPTNLVKKKASPNRLPEHQHSALWSVHPKIFCIFFLRFDFH